MRYWLGLMSKRLFAIYSGLVHWSFKIPWLLVSLGSYSHSYCISDGYTNYWQLHCQTTHCYNLVKWPSKTGSGSIVSFLNLAAVHAEVHPRKWGVMHCATVPLSGWWSVEITWVKLIINWYSGRKPIHVLNIACNMGCVWLKSPKIRSHDWRPITFLVRDLIGWVLQRCARVTVYMLILT